MHDCNTPKEVKREEGHVSNYDAALKLLKRAGPECSLEPHHVRAILESLGEGDQDTTEGHFSKGVE